MYIYLYVLLCLIVCIDEVGIEQRNELEEDYAFVYFNPEKASKKVLVKCLVMNDKLLVVALADGASEPIHLEIKFVILLSLSLSLSLDLSHLEHFFNFSLLLLLDYVTENGGTNYSCQFKNLESLVKTVDKEILWKLDG